MHFIYSVFNGYGRGAEADIWRDIQLIDVHIEKFLQFAQNSEMDRFISTSKCKYKQQLLGREGEEMEEFSRRWPSYLRHSQIAVSFATRLHQQCTLFG